MGSKRIFILMIVLLVFSVSFVGADVNYALVEKGGTASFTDWCTGCYGPYSTWSTASNVNDNDDVNTYVGLLDASSYLCGDGWAHYEAQVDFDEPRDINSIVARVRGEDGGLGFFASWQEYERIYVYIPGTGWSQIYSTTPGDGWRTRTVNGPWGGITAVKLRFRVYLCGALYTRWHRTYELRAWGCDCASGACCDGCDFIPSGTECRAAPGSCDVAEYCTGTSADCPADAFSPITTECRASAGLCDVTEFCTGTSTDCPVDTFQADTYECRAAVDSCDAAEFCTGASVDCPGDGFASAGTPCGGCMECDGFGGCFGSGNYIYKMGDHSDQYYINWLDDASDDACCDLNSDCVFNDTCYAINEVMGNLNPGGGDNIAQCGLDSEWFDLDAGGVSCSGSAGLRFIKEGEDEAVVIVGEYNDIFNGGNGVTECCGDDAGEYPIIRPIGYDSKYPPLDSDEVCCDAENDCVADGACYTSDIDSSIVGEGFDRVYCSDGAWVGGDRSSTACNLITGGTNWYFGGIFETGQGDCCGDDDNEFYRTRVCGSAVCDTLDSDGVCCDKGGSFDGDCVYSSNCYTYYSSGVCGGINNSCVDVGDASTDMEVCMGAGWTDPDNNSQACTEVDGYPRPTLWMSSTKNATCGLWETGQGSCNDVIDIEEDPRGRGFCCGDDEGESFRDGIDDVCFVDQNGCFFDGAYYENEEYFEDDYCQNGTATSRTKLIALQLLEIAKKDSPSPEQEDYTLFCDSYENTLNYYTYDMMGGFVSAVQYLGDINNICVLEMPGDLGPPNKVIFGVSLNKSISSGTFKFIDILNDAEGPINCGDAEANYDGQFNQCDSFKVWYNSKTKSVIYSNEDIAIDEINFWDKFQLFLKNPFDIIFDFLLQLVGEEAIPQPEDYEFISSVKKFSRLYLDRKGVKSIKGIIEETTQPKAEYLSVTYGCYNSDICSTVDAVFAGVGELSPCNYDESTSTYYVASNSSEGLALWTELTARLRPQAVTSLPVQACMSTESCELSGGLCLTAGKTFNPLKLATPTDSHASLGGFDIAFNQRLCCPNDYEVDSPISCQAGLLELSGMEDAHASVYGMSDFEVPVCIKSTDPAETASCEYRTTNCHSDEVCIVSLSDTVDAHVSECDGSPFEINICCKTT